MLSEIVRALIMLACYIILLIIITIFAGKKVSLFFNLLKDGAKQEFFTKPGLISLATIVMMIAVVIIFLFCNELHNAFTMSFNLNKEIKDFPFALALFAILGALITNFLFIGFMCRKPGSDKISD